MRDRLSPLLACVFAVSVALVTGCAHTPPVQRASVKVIIRAHRGGAAEVPENTLAAFEHAWSIPGAIPEADVATTSDGVLIVLHDRTLGRTTNAPKAIASVPATELTFEEVHRWDAGAKYNIRYRGQKVPALTEVFEILQARPDRELYFDQKSVELPRLMAQVEEYGLADRVIYALTSDVRAFLAEHPGSLRTFASCSGKPDVVKEKFYELAGTGFKNITHLQLHAHSVPTKKKIALAFDDAFLRDAIELTRAEGVVLQLRLFRFDSNVVGHLMDLGIPSLAGDEPKRISEYVELWRRGAL